jgi:hypothetical protein
MAVCWPVRSSSKESCTCAGRLVCRARLWVGNRKEGDSSVLLAAGWRGEGAVSEGAVSTAEGKDDPDPDHKPALSGALNGG